MRTIELWGGPCDGEFRTIPDGSKVVSVSTREGPATDWAPQDFAIQSPDTPYVRTGVYRQSPKRPHRFDWQPDDEQKVGSP